MLNLICANAEKIYLAQNESDRAATVAEQAREVEKYGVPYQTANSVAAAYRLARNEQGPQDILICGGSLYTVGELLRCAEEEKGG